MHPRKFTDMTLQTLPLPADGRTQVWDNSSPLGLRISSTGVKTFVVLLGRRRKTIGKYGHITLQQARAAAKQLKAEHTLGRLMPSSRSLVDAREEYLKAITIRPNTRHYYMSYLNRLPNCRLTDLRPADLNTVLDALPSKSRGLALKTYVAFFNWCIRRHYLDTSPCIRFKADKATSRSRVLSDLEIARIWACTTEPKETSKLPASFCTILQLLILTGMRKSEAANIRTSWINEKQQTLTIPASIAKNARALSLPISPLTWSVLEPLLKTSDDLLLPGKRKNSLFTAWSKASATLWQITDIEGATLHDIRRTVASNMGALGIRLEVIERILNHVSGSFGGVAGTYQRYEFMPEMRDAMERWEAKLLAIVH
jgi:integrase